MTRVFLRYPRAWIALPLLVALATGCQSRKKKREEPQSQVPTLRSTWGDPKEKKFKKWSEWENDQAEKFFDKVME